MSESDEGVTGQGSGAAESRHSEWEPLPLILQPKEEVHRRTRNADKHDTNEIPVVTESIRGRDDAVNGESSTVDPDLEPVVIAESDEDGPDGPVTGVVVGASVAVVLAPTSALVVASSQELVSLRKVPNGWSRAGVWLRIGTAAMVLVAVGAAATMGLTRGQFSGGEAIVPLVAPAATDANSPVPSFAATGEEGSSIDAGTSHEIEAATEELIEIPDFMARATPSTATSAPSPTTTQAPAPDAVPGLGPAITAAPPPQPIRPPVPTVQPVPPPKEVRSGTVVLTQYSDYTGTYWKYTVSAIPYRGIVKASTSDERVNNRSRALSSEISVATRVPVSREKVVWLVTVDNRFGARLYTETLTTG